MGETGRRYQLKYQKIALIDNYCESPVDRETKHRSPTSEPLMSNYRVNQVRKAWVMNIWKHNEP